MDGNMEECQFLRLVELPEDESEPEVAIPESTTHIIPSGDDLQENELSTITYQFKSNLVVLIGEPECGKSTLYAALLDRFHKGPIGDFNFAGCLTPIAFEKRAHYARLKSKSKSSDNERTKSFEFSYLHLEVRHRSLLFKSQHLLFADINGEKFQRANDADDEMSTLGILRYASHIFVLANGSTLLHNSNRHALKANIISTIERALQNQLLVGKERLNLVITKWDKIDAANEIEKINSFFIQPLKERFPTLFGEILFIASRSLNPNVKWGEGLDVFLDKCLSQGNPKQVTTKVIEEHEIVREFQRFKYHD
ncbi:hypothetical protein K1Y79_04135 [Chitinophaga sp. B61]|uniref:Double-GTPase 2 domain-containing protein n=2 Tax=Chitinophaga rhizophila TaxID=2866212 RepID=A0ABS7G796_9BACT|nr:hypothetical protein [Chitinophaga rhizophila]